MGKVHINFDGRKSLENGKPIRLPRSKSMAARRLILDFIRGYKDERADLPDCDDTLELTAALRQLREGEPASRYDLGTGGTSLRFFIALVSSLENFDGVVDCSPQLRRRPLAPLVAALRRAGADISYMERDGYAPIYIKGKKLKGGEVEIAGGVSSQFISALLMASLLWREPLRLKIEGTVVSQPYVEMTRRMMADVDSVDIEPDWSAAAFFYELCLMLPGGNVAIESLRRPELSVQGDAGCEKLFGLLGVTTHRHSESEVVLKGDGKIVESMARMPAVLELDMGKMPDLVPALAVGMAVAGIKYRFCNVGHLRNKESDRLMALQMEMEKIGYSLETGDDFISWNGRRLPVGEDEVIDSHGDHRIAMAFAMAAARVGHLTIDGAECVAKSFPGFFEELEKIGFEVKFIKE